MSAAYRLLCRTQAGRGRVAFAAAVAGILMLAAAALRAAGAGRGAVADLLGGAGLGVLTPVAALLFAVATLGDLAGDRTLVYLWLRPLPRGHLATAALGASLTAVLPLTALPVGLAALLGGRVDLLAPAVLASALGAAAYSAVFLGLGLRSRRSLLWGLLYVLLWEDGASTLAASLAAVSVRRYTTSVFTTLGGQPPARFGVGTVTAVVVLAALVGAGIALTAWLLRRHEPA